MYCSISGNLVFEVGFFFLQVILSELSHIFLGGIIYNDIWFQSFLHKRSKSGILDTKSCGQRSCLQISSPHILFHLMIYTFKLSLNSSEILVYFGFATIFANNPATYGLCFYFQAHHCFYTTSV